MKFQVVLAALVVAASAAPSKGDHHGKNETETETETLPATYTWSAINWQSGMSHGNPSAPVTGFYTFTVSGAKASVHKGDVPAFSASCSGSAHDFPLESDFANCTLNSGAKGAVVEARVYPTGDNTQCHMAISYLVSGRNVTGYTVTDWARERAPYNFTITNLTLN